MSSLGTNSVTVSSSAGASGGFNRRAAPPRLGWPSAPPRPRVPLPPNSSPRFSCSARNGNSNSGEDASRRSISTRSMARDASRRGGPAVVEPLAELAAQRAQRRALLGVLDALGHEHEPEAVAHGHDRAQQRGAGPGAPGGGAGDL